MFFCNTCFKVVWHNVKQRSFWPRVSVRDGWLIQPETNARVDICETLITCLIKQSSKLKLCRAGETLRWGEMTRSGEGRRDVQMRGDETLKWGEMRRSGEGRWYAEVRGDETLRWRQIRPPDEGRGEAQVRADLYIWSLDKIECLLKLTIDVAYKQAWLPGLMFTVTVDLELYNAQV